MESPTTSNHFIQEIIESDINSGKHAAIQTRFPPEPNGYLHIGHAKSICLNFEMARQYGGKCNLRFDDTNPEKESETYMSSIKEDVKWLGFDWDRLCYASDYFDKLYDMALELIDKGLAYVDSQSSDDIRKNRGSLSEAGVDSPFRGSSIKENRELFEKMKSGFFADGEVVLRAKIDMAAPNMNLRDPVIYRVRRVHHYRTGDKWCIYPMYDFTHGQSDMLEGVTHSLCTLEFQDHRPLYEWFIENIDTSCTPRQIEFSRLQLEYTVLSKRRLIELVENNYVDGWDDPRMPTIAGMRRRGVPPSVLREFCQKIGITKSDATIELGFFEGLLRNALNVSSARRMAVVEPLKVTIANYPGESELLSVANHPQNPEMGVREVVFSNTLYIEKDDFREEANKKFKRLKLGEEVRLRGAYVIRCNEVIKDEHGNPIELICSYDKETLGKNPSDGRKVKGVIHWVDASTSVDANIVNYDRLFNIANPMQADHFTDAVNLESKKLVLGVKLESSLALAEAGEVYQFERVGYFTRDARAASGELLFNQTIGLRDTWQS
ncbi:MAG: glutamine--tRNA ligase/YqeY domain fusion protein [Gammaproteobacteria bacterium]|nr:glutamine--tRNA ligase/YqeY domain fusion protein [Gammaproteobacteria bacterium]